MDRKVIKKGVYNCMRVLAMYVRICKHQHHFGDPASFSTCDTSDWAVFFCV